MDHAAFPIVKIIGADKQDCQAVFAWVQPSASFIVSELLGMPINKILFDDCRYAADTHKISRNR
jgi:hypothetical protein